MVVVVAGLEALLLGAGWLWVTAAEEDAGAVTAVPFLPPACAK